MSSIVSLIESHEKFKGIFTDLTGGSLIPTSSSSNSVKSKMGDSFNSDVVSVSVRTDRENVVDSIDIDANNITSIRPTVNSPLAQHE